MGTVLGIFHGTTEEAKRLLRVVERNCTCEPESASAHCPAHTLLCDQRALNGLLWMSRLQAKLVMQEWLSKPPIHPPLW